MIEKSKHILMMTLAAVVLLTGGSAWAQEGEPVDEANLPQLAVSEERFDFGRVTQGSSIAHVFWLKNVGGDTLKITDVKPGCGCTKAPLEKKELAVGDSTRVKLIFSTGHYSSRVTKSARVLCNAAGRLPRLTISADVKRNMDSLDIFTITPYSLNLDTDRAGDYTLTLKNLHNTDLEFTVVSMPDDAVEIDLPPNLNLDAGEERQFRVHFKDNVAGELFTESITFEANDPEKTRMTIPIVKSRRWGPAPTSSLN